MRIYISVIYINFSFIYIYDIIKDMNECIEERNICQEGVVYSKKKLY